MEAGQPSHGMCRRQPMSDITWEGWRLLARKQTVDALSAFGFTSVLSKQSCLLWSSALPLQPGWWPREVRSASTPVPRAGSTPLSMLPQGIPLSLSSVWLPTLCSLVWTFVMSVKAPVVTNSYVAAEAVGWLSGFHRALVILLCQRNHQRCGWAATNVEDGLWTCYKHPPAGTLRTCSFSLGDSCDLQISGQSLLCQPFPTVLACSPAWAVLRKL